MNVFVGVRFAESDIQDFDTLVKSGKYMNRSDAVRALSRQAARVELSELEDKQ